MSTNGPQNQDNQEIDLFVVSKKAGDFFQWINRMLFLSIHFLKKPIIVAVLILLGFGVGLYLDKMQQQYDHQIIVALILNRPIIYMLKSIYCPPKLLRRLCFFKLNWISICCAY
jgi:uncharacterized membrane protein